MAVDDATAGVPPMPGPERLALEVDVALDIASIVRPGAFAIDGLTVREHDTGLDGPLRDAAAAARAMADQPDITAAVRAMYRSVHLDPTKTRPSSEALLRRVRKGDELPRINGLVDVINWCSLESQLPFGLYDRHRIRGAVVLRLGRPGEEYAGIRKDVVHVDGRLTLADEEGPFGNPTSDSARTMVTPRTTSALVVVFAPARLSPATIDRTLRVTRERIDRYCR
jgi:DNA/RNA-binding domain of Phe-tRNA-synthetase-like protein